VLHLVIGNKNYSSWSFRPWLAMKVAGIPFQETVISLEASDFKARVKAISGAGKVPVLVDGGVHIWETLAILQPPVSGRARLRRAHTRGPFPSKCTPAFSRCGGNCR
jgi:hypothetical protein